MRFLKLTDVRKRHDILHVWIEDDCPEWIVSQIRGFLADERSTLQGSSGNFPTGLKLTEREYVQR